MVKVSILETLVMLWMRKIIVVMQMLPKKSILTGKKISNIEQAGKGKHN